MLVLQRQACLKRPAATAAHSAWNQRCAPAVQTPSSILPYLPCGRLIPRHHSTRLHATEKNTQQDLRGGLHGLEVAVPADQRPVNELKSLKQGQLFSWATLDTPDYVKRLAIVFAAFFSLVGGPIAYQTFDPLQQPAEWVLSASVGSLVVVALLVVRIYLGWAYVSDRLMSAAVEYEETGWYDGQLFVKPPEVLTRDRLLGMYEVKPVMAKLRTTLIGSGGMLLCCAVLLFGIIQAGTDQDGMYGRGAARAPRQVTADGLIFSDKVKDLSRLSDDDELAAEEAAAQGGVPGYCSDRMLRAVAGGQYCDRFDVK